MTKSVKANYLFNLINSASQLLFPLITFPYASRIMLADIVTGKQIGRAHV